MTNPVRLLSKKDFTPPRLWFELLFLVVTLAVALTATSLVLRGAGWPQSHEGLAFWDRTAIYADHFRHGDLFPIWSSSDAYGMGTPLPLFYHKTFYWVSSPLYILSGSMKFAIYGAIILFMLVGVYGMRWCVQTFTKKRWFIVLAPQALLLANYTFTDWLVRGATAEFSSMMLIPWLIWWCLALVRDKRFSYAITPIIFLLVNAHNVTALYAMFMVLIACIIFLVAEGKAGVLREWKRLAISVGVTAVLLAPQLILQKLFLADYDPGKITQDGFLATQNFHPAGEYFVNSHYTWLQLWQPYSVQIDYAIWITIAFGLAAAVLATGEAPRRVWPWIKRNILNQTGIFLMASLLIFVLLQFKMSRGFYEAVPSLQFLQFPWRLLAFITPLGILVVVLAVTRFRGKWTYAFVVAWLVWFALSSPLVHDFKFAFIGPSIAKQSITPRPGGIGGTLTGIGEYLPRIYQHNQQVTSMQTLQTYQDMYTNQAQIKVTGASCQVTEQPVKTFETSKLRFRLTCNGPATVALPVSYNRYSKVIDEHTGKRIGYFRKRDDPRIMIAIPQATQTFVDVDLPTVVQVIKLL